MVEYDRSVIQDFARRLYRAAKTVIIVFTLIGLLAGAGLGFIVSNSVRGSSPEIVISFCSIFVGVIACWAGIQRSFALRLRAQLALCQMMIEVNTRPIPQVGPAPRPMASTQPMATAR
jgi:hypothetical protein